MLNSSELNSAGLGHFDLKQLLLENSYFFCLSVSKLLMKIKLFCKLVEKILKKCFGFPVESFCLSWLTEKQGQTFKGIETSFSCGQMSVERVT